jgi:hypothetical protein
MVEDNNLVFGGHMYSLFDIKQALQYGSENKYVLFPETRDKSILEAIKDNGKQRTQLEDIKINAALAMGEASPIINFRIFKEFEITGNRLIFEKAYFKRRKQLFSLVLAYILERNEQYKSAIEEKLWEWCDLYSWELPAHFRMKQKAEDNSFEDADKTVALFAAESAFFFAEILSLIGDDLDEFIGYRLKQEIFRRVINPFKHSNYWWETAEMNWASVCAGSVGCAAMYLIEDIEELSLIVQRVINALEYYLNSFDKDGVTAEGLSYWSYGFSFYVFFAELLKERTCGKINLLNTLEKIKSIARLPQILQFPSGDFVNFSDSGSGRWQGEGGLFAKLERELNITGYNYENSTGIYADDTFRWAVMARKLFWYYDKDEKTTDILQGSFCFDESQWLVDRRCIEGVFSAFAAKGGHNDEPHNHNDLGHFLLHYNNENFFIDLGSPEYVKEYFNNATRYDFLAAASLGHSVPLINGKEQSFGKAYCTEVIKYDSTEHNTLFELDLTKAYNCPELVGFRREFNWNFNLLELSIKDSFEFNKDNNLIEEVFVTEFKPEQIRRGNVKIYGEKSSAELLYPEEFECTIEECKFNDHSGKERVIYRTSITAKVTGMVQCDMRIKLFLSRG